jgi:hypothetical protein
MTAFTKEATEHFLGAENFWLRILEMQKWRNEKMEMTAEEGNEGGNRIGQKRGRKRWGKLEDSSGQRREGGGNEIA